MDELNYLAEKSRNERRIFNQYKDLIEKSREHFAQELNSIVPGVDINSKSDKLTKDELNALIAHAYLRVDQLRRQLIEQQVWNLSYWLKRFLKRNLRILKIKLFNFLVFFSNFLF